MNTGDIASIVAAAVIPISIAAVAIAYLIVEGRRR